MSKEVIFKQEARKRVLIGINIAGDSVTPTIGPKGRNAIIYRPVGYDIVTNDGYTIVKDIELEDHFENMGVKLVKQGAEAQNDGPGDGTSTTVTLIQALANEAMKYIETNINPVGIRLGMLEAKDRVVEYLRENSKSIKTREEIVNVATISAESRERGELIATVIEAVGKDGVVTVEQSPTPGISHEIVKGMYFDNGFLSPTDETEIELEDVRILVTDKKITSVNQILKLLQKLEEAGVQNLLIVGTGFDDKVLFDNEINRQRGLINVMCVNAPEFADNRRRALQDIAVMTGADLVDDSMELTQLETDVLGHAQKVLSTRSRTTFIEGAGIKSAINKKIAEVRRQIKEAEIESDKEYLRKRLAKIAGGVAVIKVGALTETEAVYLKHKMEDAVLATKAAIEEGILVGGGCALAKASFNIKSDEVDREKRAGFDIVMTALRTPLLHIVGNTEFNAQIALHYAGSSKSNIGFNAKTGEQSIDMFKAGIIDPLMVTRLAVENAVSIASLFISIDSAQAEAIQSKLVV